MDTYNKTRVSSKGIACLQSWGQIVNSDISREQYYEPQNIIDESTQTNRIIIVCIYTACPEYFMFK